MSAAASQVADRSRGGSGRCPHPLPLSRSGRGELELKSESCPFSPTPLSLRERGAKKEGTPSPCWNEGQRKKGCPPPAGTRGEEGKPPRLGGPCFLPFPLRERGAKKEPDHSQPPVARLRALPHVVFVGAQHAVPARRRFPRRDQEGGYPRVRTRCCLRERGAKKEGRPFVGGYRATRGGFPVGPVRVPSVFVGARHAVPAQCRSHAFGWERAGLPLS